MRIPPVLARCLLVALTRCLLACQMELFNDVVDSRCKDSSEISDAMQIRGRGRSGPPAGPDCWP